MTQQLLRRFLVVMLASVSAVQAHPLHWAEESVGFGSGLLHPFSSSDHILTMLAVGMWICRTGSGKSFVWQVLLFLCMLLLGGGLTLIPLQIAHAETLMYASVLVLGLLLVSGRKLHWVFSLLLIAAVAVFHGYVHALAIWLDVEALGYTAGFALATSSLLAIGVAVNLGILMLLAKLAGRMPQ